MKTRNLCEECVKEEHPEVVERIARGCRYCGEKGGSICPPCSKEFRRFMESKGVTWPLHQLTKEEIAGKATVFLEVMEHMKRWVAEGRPGDAGDKGDADDAGV